jgi:steroid delta-isomerase-like uncharacterized protein
VSVDKNKAMLRRFFLELFNEGDLAVADEIVSADYVNHDAMPGEAPGREGLKQYVQYVRSAFPDGHFTIDDQIAENDKVVTRFTTTGTHQGEFMGIPATGRSVEITAINIHRIVDGQIREAWLNIDRLGLMQQLGVIPESPA